MRASRLDAPDGDRSNLVGFGEVFGARVGEPDSFGFARADLGATIVGSCVVGATSLGVHVDGVVALGSKPQVRYANALPVVALV